MGSTFFIWESLSDSYPGFAFQLHRSFTIALMASTVQVAPERVIQLESTLRSVIRGQDQVVRLALVCLFARGHLLIEGVPGSARLPWRMHLHVDWIASSSDCSSPATCCRAMCLGISIYSTAEQKFEFKHGPVFTNVLLADEINRTTPKTQSALLEAMNEAQVTVDSHSYTLPKPFLVIATQNPVEHRNLSAAGVADGPIPMRLP